MQLYPAIDLRAGRVVRLWQGDYDRETFYGDDPPAVAAAFVEAGALWIHVVDLDAARSGERTNGSVVAAIVEAVAGRARVQCGGGVRDERAAADLADAGVTRVVMGTAALRDPDLVTRVSAWMAVAVGLDHRGGELAAHGWTESTGLRLIEVLDWFPSAAAFVVTEIGRDSTLAGPDLDGLAAVLGATAVPVIASGGVGSLDDVKALDALDASGRRLAGVIVGKAIYEHRFAVADAVAVL
ncbi:MAG: phosphoribosylformimino-5-aminoimidazole carboxamide ribotide isomerase [Acidimicrobiaceae bacterium]|jgi:phosphoribosylformimino-5-aminoimidazole carboxamide ribotide isomerase|nr:phosphoribosylformimino-5-aminoimidazole carboxamide ribotide isomerase [Acidimicrobiaceae bacterium]